MVTPSCWDVIPSLSVPLLKSPEVPILSKLEAGTKTVFDGKPVHNLDHVLAASVI